MRRLSLLELLCSGGAKRGLESLGEHIVLIEELHANALSWKRDIFG